MSDVNAPAPEKQHFHLGDFDGPLDLLLFLIRKSEVNIYDIPIASITEQYLAYLSFAAKVDLDTMSEFHLMAATLLYIKSKMLLPVELNMDDELEDPRRDLVEKLIEYQKFRKLSELMSDREGEVEWIIERTKSQRILPFADEGIWDQVNVWDLLQTFSSLLSHLSSERIIDLYEEVSVNEKITLIAYSPLALGNIAKSMPKPLLQKYKMTPAQVMLNWVTRHQQVVAIPKAADIGHVEENASSVSVRFEPSEYEQIGVD